MEVMKVAINHILDILLPHSWVESIMAFIDFSGIVAIITFKTGFLHTLDQGLETGIKALTFVSLLITVILKLIKFKKKKNDPND